MLRDSSWSFLFLICVSVTGPAFAQSAPAATPPAPAASAESAAATPEVAAASAANHSAKEPEIVPPKSSERRESLEPKVAEAKEPGRATFDVDPIADSALIAVSFGTALLLDAINSTGEIRPQQIERSFDRNQLVGIDRSSITATPDSKAGPRSNLGLGLAVAFAVVDPVLSGFRERSVQTGLVDAMLYAETTSLTLALTDVVKMAVRRPRPRAYIEADLHRDDPNYSNASTDSALSFFSGHASMTASIGATATYLAFTRSPNSWRPWVTLGVATGVTTFVSIERVRAGKNFPTDVLAGAFVGAGIGVIVPHLHRSEDVQQRRVWVGYAPTDTRLSQGGVLNLSGVF
jgi:undecaprenyl-diphosphatase